MINPLDAGWSSLVARRAHNPKVAGSNPAPATRASCRIAKLVRPAESPCEWTCSDHPRQQQHKMNPSLSATRLLRVWRAALAVSAVERRERGVDRRSGAARQSQHPGRRSSGRGLQPSHRTRGLPRHRGLPRPGCTFRECRALCLITRFACALRWSRTTREGNRRGPIRRAASGARRSILDTARRTSLCQGRQGLVLEKPLPVLTGQTTSSTSATRLAR